MNKSFKLLMLLALGAGMFTLNSCSEDPVPVCYMTTSVEDGTTITIAYNSDNQVVSSTYDSTTTTYEYSGGRLSTAYDGYTEATFIYTSGNIPSRVNIKEDGLAAGYWIIESTDGNVTKIELHDADDLVTEVTVATYVSGNLSSMLLQEYNYDLQEYETTFQLSGIVTDGKKNPYTTSFALVYANLGSPFSFGQSNITSGNLSQSGVVLPVVATHTYNSNNYPTASSLTLGGQAVSALSYTYDCK
jgi:hypothetical protein